MEKTDRKQPRNNVLIINRESDTALVPGQGVLMNPTAETTVSFKPTEPDTREQAEIVKPEIPGIR